MLDSQTKDKYVRMANMILAQVSLTQIAQALNLSVGRVSQIQETEEFRQVLAECSGDYYERQRTLNEGWDLVEETALTNVIDMLRYNKDPEYLLRAAAMANRAQRRGADPRNKPLDAANAVGRPVVIQLNQMFVKRIQSVGLQASIVENDGEKKQADLLPPARVEALLDIRQAKQSKKQMEIEEIDSLFEDGEGVFKIAGE